MAPRRAALGAAGEALAGAHLEQLGFTIVGRNFRCRAGEIDLVAARGGVVYVVEVKTRTSARFGTALEAVNDLKRDRLAACAKEWRALAGWGGPLRQLVVAITVAVHADAA